MTRATLGMRRRGAVPEPTNNIYTVMLAISCVFALTATVVSVVDLVVRYKVEWWQAIWPF